jgi:hypothetical protein
MTLRRGRRASLIFGIAGPRSLETIADAIGGPSTVDRSRRAALPALSYR